MTTVDQHLAELRHDLVAAAARLGRRERRRRRLVVAAAAAAAVLALAGVGVATGVIDGPRAPERVMDDLRFIARTSDPRSPSGAPIPDRARAVAQLDGEHVLYATATTGGGACWGLETPAARGGWSCSGPSGRGWTVAAEPAGTVLVAGRAPRGAAAFHVENHGRAVDVAVGSGGWFIGRIADRSLFDAGGRYAFVDASGDVVPPHGQTTGRFWRSPLG